MGAQKFMGAQKLLRGHDASASLRHPQMSPDPVHELDLLKRPIPVLNHCITAKHYTICCC